MWNMRTTVPDMFKKQQLAEGQKSYFVNLSNQGFLY